MENQKTKQKSKKFNQNNCMTDKFKSVCINGTSNQV